MGYKIQLRLFATTIAISPAADQKKICTFMKLLDSFLDVQTLYS
jgi:hypothetical protein